jgi:hypothetical protein
MEYAGRGAVVIDGVNGKLMIDGREIGLGQLSLPAIGYSVEPGLIEFEMRVTDEGEALFRELARAQAADALPRLVLRYRMAGWALHSGLPKARRYGRGAAAALRAHRRQLKRDIRRCRQVLARWKGGEGA